MIATAKDKRVISVFTLAMVNVSIMASLRNLPLVAELGYKMIFFFLIVAIAFLLPSALISAELSTGWSQSGGIYIWVKEALGDRWGFFSIWMQWIHNVTWYPAILTFVAVTLSNIFLPDLQGNKYFIQSIVIIVFWGMTLTNYFAIETSAIVSTAGVIAGTVLPGLLIIGLALFFLLSGFKPQVSFSLKEMVPDLSSWSNIVFLAGFFLAFGGLEVSAGFAGEVKNPKKSFPKAILIASIITFFLFIFGALSISIVIPKEKISLVSGLVDALSLYLNHFGMSWLLPLTGILLSVGAVAEVNSWIIGPVKALHTTSIHGNLPPFFQKLNKYGMPINLLLFQAIIVTLASFIIIYMPSLSTSYWILTALSAQMYLVMYVFMFISAIRLRYTHPHVPRVYEVPYKFKGIWLFSSIGIIASIFAIVIGFIPPIEFETGNNLTYFSILFFSLMAMIAVPLIIYYFKKDSWLDYLSK